MEETKTEDVVIIGAGPAGTAAAIQLKRYGLDPLILERQRVGGLLVNANLVENYPGFPDGITGRKMVALLERHLQKMKVRILFENVDELSHNGEYFTVKTQERTLCSKAVIIASGTQHRAPELQIPVEAGERVFFEVFPLLREQGKKIAIVGAGDAAFDFALNLAGKNEVFILNRSERARCLPILGERAEENKEIHYLESTHIREICPSASGLTLRCLTRTGNLDLSVDFLTFAIGREPSLEFLTAELRKRLGEFRGKGILYLVGDVKNGLYRQTAIAAGDGIRAAMELYERLREKTQ